MFNDDLKITASRTERWDIILAWIVLERAVGTARGDFGPGG